MRRDSAALTMYFGSFDTPSLGFLAPAVCSILGISHSLSFLEDRLCDSKEMQRCLGFSVDVGGRVNEGIADAIRASGAGREPLAGKRRHFVRFAVPAMIGSIDSGLLRDLFGFEYFDLCLLAVHWQARLPGGAGTLS